LLIPPPSMYLSSPSTSTSRLLRDDSQATLLDVNSLPRPDPISPDESSQAASYYDVTACNTPSRWSFTEKTKENVDVLAV
jgi:hypothetical protein